MGYRYDVLKALLAVPLPVWGFISALEPWQLLVVAVAAMPLAGILGIAVGLFQGLRDGVSYRIYKALTGRERSRTSND